MKGIERSSITRVVSDAIMADAVIDLSGLSFLENVRKKYGITADDETRSVPMTLEEAVRILQQSPENLRNDVLEDVENIIMSSGKCSRQEALLLLSLTTCLTNKITSQAKVFSIKCPIDIIMEESQIIYVEGNFHKEYNQEIEQRYREIVNELRLTRHSFVYLPKVAEHYRQIGEKDLCSLLAFLYPNANDNLLKQILRQVTTLNTSDFCKERIFTQLKQCEWSEVMPSLLINAGSSSVKNETYTNLLLVTLQNGPLQTIRMVSDFLRSTFYPRIINPICETEQRFVFRGVFKRVFDSIVVKKGKRSRVAVDFIGGEILLPEVGVRLNWLHRREKALYVLFLIESRKGGINFNRPVSADGLEEYKHRISVIQEKYGILYEKFGGDRWSAPDIEISSNRLPMISLINREFRQLDGLLDDVDGYRVQRNKFGNYYVKRSSDLYCRYSIREKQYHKFTENYFLNGGGGEI